MKRKNAPTSPQPVTGDKRQEALDMAMSSIERSHGKGAIMRLGDDSNLNAELEAVSTGSLGLDIALGIGGLPRGRIIEIYGPESSGKTTLTLQSIAQAQKAYKKLHGGDPIQRWITADICAAIASKVCRTASNK